MSPRRPGRDQRGFGLIEIVLVLVVVAVSGYLLMQYFGSTAKTVETLQQERPLERTKLAADQATLASVQGMVRTYQAQNEIGRASCRERVYVLV